MWDELMITVSTWNCNCLCKSICKAFSCFNQFTFCDKNEFNTLNVIFPVLKHVMWIENLRIINTLKARIRNKLVHCAICFTP